MSGQMLIAFIVVSAMMGRVCEALVCTTNADCVNIPRGATGICTNRVCACLSYYSITTSGCQLNLPAPTLHSNSVHGMARGGDYSFTCIPGVSLSQQTDVTYRLMRGETMIQSVQNNQTFMIRDVDDEDKGTYTCIHTYDSQWSPRSNQMVVQVVEAGWVCSSDQNCPNSKGYRQECDRETARCVCEDDYTRKGTQCVSDGATSNMAASALVVLVAAVVSRML